MQLKNALSDGLPRLCKALTHTENKIVNLPDIGQNYTIDLLSTNSLKRIYNLHKTVECGHAGVTGT
jgi:hypothetical protein